MGSEWTAAWQNWPQAARFWGQVVGYTLPAPDLGLLQLQAQVEPDGVVTVSAEGVTATGQTVDLAETRAVLLTPGQRRLTINLRQTAPGRYEQRLRLADPGAYELRVDQARPGGEPVEKATVGFVVPYPAEFGLPVDGAGPGLLEQVAALTGGRYLSLSEAPAGAESPAAGSPAGRPLELWPWLLLASLALWPLEIAWRRWGRLRIQ
jgi:hypothetical protein